MKYFLAIIISVLLLSSCDDGNLITENFVFENATVQKCSDSNVLYKINGAEALIFKSLDIYFENIEQVKTYSISGNANLIYRKFATTTSTNNICNTPTIPVLEEWTVTGGTVQITTTKILDSNRTTVVAYTHNIVFKNITFTTPSKQIVYDTYVFGNYRTEVVDLHFGYDLITTQNCGGSNLILKYNNNNALLLDVDATLFPNSTVGSPRTRVINSTTNKVVYRVYNGSLNTNFFCSAITPSTPNLTEEWIAQNGVEGASGEIRVVTVAIDATHFKHTITLYKTTFKKGVLTYIFPTSDNFIFGTYITTI
ncbi:TPA: hypothetical protein ACT5CK_000075 [Flavobacterium psychrophilum]|uniref:hypothetical protein n=1 Tax=Flavobacterium psychrophilum TaxID=96345 RepID=UPI00073F0BED|nr:hypothetical protein [Flavobacterium psychrophilum]SNB97880.1 putative lipoprotein [Flavobacterium psychrophilum]GAQ49927.1 hypothetical protein FPK15_contig00072-0005 [Flavobacterium psychrophilum]GAW88376.1 hypothetical protein FPS14_contig00004-0040 [Flavobacterium psychrophilum]GEJ31764.1 hypothetical protein FPN181_contig00013-0003 [Flavobacterium psychrophilum]GEJ36977.1 hypothetical protein FPN182_contig00014-0003 [Flavobacterium psychrophilum]